MTWSPHEQSIDYFLAAGKRSPGLADVEGADVLRRLKERRGFGISGGFAVFAGVPLVKFTIKIRLYTAQHWIDWHAWKSVIYALPRNRTGAVDVWHPLLEEIGVTAALVETVSQPTQTADGEWTVTIKFLEQRSVKLALSRPEGAKASPVDPVDALIDANTARIQELALQ